MSKIAFRCDATAQIGTGHFMRCLTLAEKLKQQGGQIRFVCRELPEHLQSMLAAKGIEYAPIGESEEVVAGDLVHSQWLPAGQEADALATTQALADHCWDWLVVDHYALDVRWESAMRSLAKRIMVIDDLADRQHDCDLLMDQNYYADMQSRYAGKTPTHCQLLLGPRYALLRDEFRELRKQVHPRTGQVKMILVFFGGADADNYTGVAVQALSELGVPGIQVDVVIGAQHPAREEIEQTCAALGYHCHVQTSRMAELMAEADLAIGAGGSACWERCSMGLPTLAIAVADNQIKIADDLEQARSISVMRTPERMTAQSMLEHIRRLISNSVTMIEMSECGLQLVDGEGTHRVLDEMAAL